MRTIDAHSPGDGDVVQHNAAVCQPFNGFRRVFNEAVQQCRVVFVFAAFQGFLIEQLLAVSDAFEFLEAGFRCVHPHRGLDGVAADGRHFLDNQHTGVVVAGLNGCRQAGAAAANHHHVITWRLQGAFFQRHGFAGFGDGLGDGFFHRFALGGGAADRVYVRAVGVKNA